MTDTLARDIHFLMALREQVLQNWDPIGIKDFVEAQDEYDSYILPIAEILNGENPEDNLFRYLWLLETEWMGLSGDKERTKKFSEDLYQFFKDYEKRFYRNNKPYWQQSKAGTR